MKKAYSVVILSDKLGWVCAIMVDDVRGGVRGVGRVEEMKMSW